MRKFAEGGNGLAGMDTTLADEAMETITREEYYRQQQEAKPARLDSRADSHAHAKPRRQVDDR